jgi:hypothetical protein
MRRLIAILAASVLLLGIPMGTALAAGPKATDATGDSPVTPQGAVGACEIMVNVHGGPLSNGPVTLRVYQDLGVFGFDFPLETQVVIEFTTSGLVESFDVMTDTNGDFEEYFFFDGEDPPSPVSWVVKAFDPAHPGACTDSASFQLIASTPFTDIGGNPFRLNIIWLYHEGITGGCTSTLFCPKDAVTREQMASFLARALNLPATNQNFFTDDDTSIHHGAINRLAAAGITGGCAPNQFCPKDLVTRAQMASFLARALKLPATNQNFFTDDNNSIHEGAINRLAAAGITGGCHPTIAWFCPGLSVTREQMAAFLDRGINR